MLTILSSIILLILTLNIKSQDMVVTTPQQDSLQMPIFDYTPKIIKIKKEGRRFLEQEIKILNRGGSMLEIKDVKPSCQCGSFKVLRGFINPMTTGKMILSVNTDAMGEGQDILEFEVISNAKNSPTIIKFEVIKD